jgi:hypothetical protein
MKLYFIAIFVKNPLKKKIKKTHYNAKTARVVYAGIALHTYICLIDIWKIKMMEKEQNYNKFFFLFTILIMF